MIVEDMNVDMNVLRYDMIDIYMMSHISDLFWMRISLGSQWRPKCLEK